MYSHRSYYGKSNSYGSDEATPAQVGFIKNLIRDRDHDMQEGQISWDGLTKRHASVIIDHLKMSPHKETRPSKPADATDAHPGYYVRDGEVYKVVSSKRNPGRSYAKHLEIHLNAAGSKCARWEYSPGTQRTLDGRDILTVEEAARLGHLHGFCVICGKQLTVPKHVEAGIGPVCIRTLHKSYAEIKATAEAVAEEVAA